jgi:hypothetical protein
MQRSDALKDVRFRTGLLFGCAIFFAIGALKLAHEEMPNRQSSVDINCFILGMRKCINDNPDVSYEFAAFKLKECKF